MNAWLIVVGAGLLLADLGLAVALRRRIPVDRVSLYTLPLFIVGVVLLVVGVA